MSEAALRRQLQRERAKVAFLEDLIEDHTRNLYLSKETLRASHQYTEDIQRLMPGALWVADLDNRVLQANEAAMRLFGGPSTGLRVSALFSDRLPALVDQDRQEAVLTRLDGGSVPVLLSRRLVSEARRQLWIAVDLTEQKRLETRLRQSQKLEAIGTLAAGLAHELNTPIQFIKNNLSFLEEAYADLMAMLSAARVLGAAYPDSVESRAFNSLCAQSDLDMLTDEIPRAMASLQEGAGRVSRIVKAMNTFAYPHQQDIKSFDVNEGIRMSATIADAEVKQVADLELDLSEVSPIKCRGDDLNRVFLNLIVNAAHAIKDAQPERGLIKIETKELADHIEVVFSDNGTGIPEAIQERVFEPFFTTKPVGEGTGQGLAMAHNIVEWHGGSIEFESEFGRGTRFILTIPKSPLCEATS